MGGATHREEIEQMLDEARRADERAAAGHTSQTAPEQPRWRKWFREHRLRAFLMVLIILCALVALVPTLRFGIGGLFVTRDAVITVLDDQSGQPVSNVTVTIRGASYQTGADGRVELDHIKPGKPHVSVSKQYYETATPTVYIGLLSKTYTQTVRLKPTGRAVPVRVTNKLSGLPIAGVSIVAGGTEATTGESGEITMVFDSTASTVDAELKADGYNTQRTTLSAPGDVSTNTIALTPAGKVYVLSKQSGNLDVIKMNLDGSEREVAVKATGAEEVANTQLWPSADWQFIVLKARREGERASLYLLDTSSDKLTEIDTRQVEFQAVGWHKHSFVYATQDPGKQEWQPGRNQLKVFNADNGERTDVETTQASGTGYDDYMTQVITPAYIVNGMLVYGLQWSGATPDTHKQQTTLYEVPLDASPKKRELRKDANATLLFSQPEPDALNIQVSGEKTTVYQYRGGNLSAVHVTAEQMLQPVPAYYPGPQGDFLWSSRVDGAYDVFVGSGLDHKATLLQGSELQAWGWYGHDYVLLTRNDSELYILPADPSLRAQPQKLTHYHRPPGGF